jgi:hypothetical protein
MVCSGTVWQSLLSFNSTAQVTNVGNQTCLSGQVLQFDGTKFACGTGVSGGGTAMVKIASTDIATATTSYTFSGLAGDTDTEYQIVTRIVEGSACGGRGRYRRAGGARAATEARACPSAGQTAVDTRSTTRLLFMPRAAIRERRTISRSKI